MKILVPFDISGQRLLDEIATAASSDRRRYLEFHACDSLLDLARCEQSAPAHDIAIFVERATTLPEFAMRAVLQSGGGPGELQRWAREFEQHSASRILHGTLILQPSAPPRQPIRLFRTLAPTATLTDAESLLAWLEQCTDPNLRARLLEETPLHSGQWHFRTRHAMGDGKLRTIGFSLVTRHPFDEELQCPPWTATLMTLVNGHRPIAELARALQARGVAEADFWRALELFLGLGALRLPSLTL